MLNEQFEVYVVIQNDWYRWGEAIALRSESLSVERYDQPDSV